MEPSQSSSAVSNEHNTPSPWAGPPPWGPNRDTFSPPTSRPQKRSGGVRPSKVLQHLSLTAVPEPLAPLASVDISLLHMPVLFSPPATKLLTHPHTHPTADSYFHHYFPPIQTTPALPTLPDCEVKVEEDGMESSGGWGVEPQQGSVEEAFTPKTREMMVGFEETFVAAPGEDHLMRGVRVINGGGGRGLLSSTTPNLSTFLDSFSPYLAPFSAVDQQTSFTDLLTMPVGQPQTNER